MPLPPVPPLPPARGRGVRGRPQRRRRRGWGVALLALLLAAAIWFAPSAPSWQGVGTGWNSFLPWSAVGILLLGLIALARRAWWGLAAVLVPALVWSVMFVPQLLPRIETAQTPDLTVATQNIGAANADPGAAADALIASGAGLVAVQELSSTTGAAAGQQLDAAYPHHTTIGTVGLWSDWDLGQTKGLELGLGWARALRVTVEHPLGQIAVYVVHLASVRPGDTTARDAGLQELSALIAADPAARVMVVGDLNTAGTDPRFADITNLMADTRTATGSGFGFTWPAGFPLTRPDHVLVRGLTVTSDEVLDGAGSDHRAVLAGLRFWAEPVRLNRAGSTGQDAADG